MGAEEGRQKIVITLEDIHLTYNPNTAAENHVLRGLNLRMESGEFVTLIGGNGAGKSSLMNVIGGSTRQDSGRIFIGGKDVSDDSACIRASRVARVFQNPLDGICMRLSVEQNMALAYGRGRRPSLFRPAVTRKLRRTIEEKLSSLGLGLEKRLGDQMGRLSGGQYQAVSLLMASMQPSEILLLDEHTSSLDPLAAASVMDLTKNIVAKNKLTTLMVTHSLKLAIHHGTRLIVLHRGEMALEFSGQEKAKLHMSDLMRIFEETSGEEENAAAN